MLSLCSLFTTVFLFSFPESQTEKGSVKRDGWEKGRRGEECNTREREREIIHCSPRLVPSLAHFRCWVSLSFTLSPLIHSHPWFRLQILIGGPILIKAKLKIEMGSHFVTHCEMWSEIWVLNERVEWVAQTPLLISLPCLF